MVLFLRNLVSRCSKPCRYNGFEWSHNGQSRLHHQASPTSSSGVITNQRQQVNVSSSSSSSSHHTAASNQRRKIHEITTTLTSRSFSASGNGGDNHDDDTTSKPLFLWIDPMNGVDLSASSSSSSSSSSIIPLLVPAVRPNTPNVTSPADALKIIHQHYSMDHDDESNDDHNNNNNNEINNYNNIKKQQFVGGMGENDAGVAFCAIANASVDIFQYQMDMLHETIELIRSERHGIPLTIYTSGLLLPPHLSSHVISSLSELGMNVLQVSLMAGNPTEYVKATTTTTTVPQSPSQQQRSAADFGQVCGFIAAALEANEDRSSFAVEVGVVARYATSGRALALALGAQQVHVYPDDL